MYKRTFVCLMVMAVVAGLRVEGVYAQGSPKVMDAVNQLKQETSALGAARAEGGVLYFGSTKINDDFTIVDKIKTSKGCTATLFVKQGDNFTRISTNVMAEGKRAVGTCLDVRGGAYKAIAKGQAFYGVVDVVGTKMDTAYEPIKDGQGNVIGIYYVGFPVQ